MATWLIKTEPDAYSYDDLIRDKREPWDGVTNPAAQMHMRAIKKGDEVLVYHTGKERRVAGLAASRENRRHPGTHRALADDQLTLALDDGCVADLHARHIRDPIVRPRLPFEPDAERARIRCRLGTCVGPAQDGHTHREGCEPEGQSPASFFT